MKKVYLDTSAYNAILDHPKRDLIVCGLKGNDFEVVCSLWNLEEILHEKNSDRRITLCKLALDLSNGRLFMTSKDLMIKEVEAMLARQILAIDEVLIMFDKESDPFKKIIDGPIFDSTPEHLFKEFKNNKRSFLQDMKKKKDLVVGKWEPYRNLPFDEFYSRAIKNKMGRLLIADIIADLSGATPSNEMIDSIESMPGLHSHLKFWLGLIYGHVVQNAKPKWGDNIDVHHVTYLPYCDVFVTNDEALRALALCVGESTECIFLDEFIKNMDKSP